MPQNPNYSAEESAADGRVAALVGVALSAAEDKNQAIVRLRQLAGEWFQLGKANDARALVVELIGWCEANNAPAEVLNNLRGDMSAIEAHKASAGVARDSSDEPPESKPQQKTKSAADTSGQNTSETFMKWLAIPLAVAVVVLLWRVSGDLSGTAEVAPPVTITVTQSAPSKDLPTATAATLDSAPKVAPPKDAPVTESAARKPAPKPAEATMYVVASGGVNVRVTTDATSRVVKKVGQFTDVIGVGKPENRWQKVRIDGHEGYIYADLLAQGGGKTARCVAGIDHPLNGHVFTQHGEGDHTVEIKNSGKDDALAKFKNASGRTILSFYVRGGESVEIDNVADGTYEFLYSTGERFSITCEKFMKDAQYKKDTMPRSMVATPFKASHLQYSLRPLLGGNVKTRDISEEEFLQ